MARLQKSIDINVPVSTAWGQWTQFEDLAWFMGGIEQVCMFEDGRSEWRARLAGVPIEWQAEITEWIPEKRLAWRSHAGAPNAGVVTFHRTAPDRTRLMLQLEYWPRSWGERIGSWLGVVRRRVFGDLIRFKCFIEERGVATGAGLPIEVPAAPAHEAA